MVSRQHLADLLAATRNTSALQVSAASHDGLYRWFLGVGVFPPQPFFQQLGKLTWIYDLHCSWKLVSLGFASMQFCWPHSHAALTLPATEVKHPTLRLNGVPRKHSYRGFGNTATSFRASLGPLAQHHIMYVSVCSPKYISLYSLQTAWHCHT